jgi:hypothetical protein
VQPSTSKVYLFCLKVGLKGLIYPVSAPQPKEATFGITFENQLLPGGKFSG